jgi:hypothetical protein
MLMFGVFVVLVLVFGFWFLVFGFWVNEDEYCKSFGVVEEEMMAS